MTRRAMLIGSMLVGATMVGVASAERGARPTVGFTAYPVGDHANRWFQVEIAPGDTAALTAGAINKGTAPVALRAFVTNATNGINGGFSAGAEDDALTSPASWIEFAAESFEIAPGTARHWDFTVSVPEGTDPGQYVAAIVVRTQDALRVPGSDVFDQVLRSAMAIEITVPGTAASGLALGAPVIVADPAGQALRIPVSNTGDVTVLPEGAIVLTTVSGTELLAEPVAMGSIYGGGSTTLHVQLPTLVEAGDYLVSLDLVDPASGASASIAEVMVTLAEAEVLQ